MEENEMTLELPKVHRQKSIRKKSPRDQVNGVVRATESDSVVTRESKQKRRRKRASLKLSRLTPSSLSSNNINNSKQSPKHSPKKRESVSRTRSLKELSDRLSFHSLSHSKKEKPESKKTLTISPVIKTSHIKHVDEEEANQFLLRLLKQREEKYAHVHHEISGSRTNGEIYLKPSTTMMNQFKLIIQSEEIKQCNLDIDKNKYVKLWFELIPQASHDIKETGSWIFVKPGTHSKDIIKKNSRWDRVEYFPSNIFNIDPESKSEIVRFTKETKKENIEVSNSSLDYVLVFYISKSQTQSNQILGVIPLEEVKILSINPTEISISYINQMANTHYLRFKTKEETLEWIKVLELATQTQIKRVVKGISLKSLQRITGSVKDLRKYGSQVDINTIIKKKSYLPIYWDKETLYEDSYQCFSECLELTEHFDHSLEDEVRQGWRVLGGSMEDLILWCLITSDRPNSENIDVYAILLSFSCISILENLEIILDKVKKQTKQPKFSKGMQFLMKRSPSDLSSEAPDIIINRKLFYMVEQWLKFLAIPVIHEDDAIDFCDTLIKFCSNRVKREHLLVLKGLNQQIQNQRVNVPIIPIIPLQSRWDGESDILSILDVHPTILAEQLTIIEAAFHARIRHRELLHLNFDKNPELAKNITALSEHFNTVSLWVATQILREETPKMQAKIVTRFLKIAEILFKIRNYSSCVQILSGISNVAIQRLKRMQKFLDAKTLTRYDNLSNHFDPVSGYSNYRLLSFELPCLHLYAVSLRTLTLIEEGNPKFLGDDKNIICFSRMTMIAECIEKLNLYKPEAWQYNFQPDENIQNWLSQMRALPDEQLYELSIKYEAKRNNNNNTFSEPVILPDMSKHYKNPLYGKKGIEKSGKIFTPDLSNDERQLRKRNSKKRIMGRKSSIIGKILGHSGN